MQEPNYRLFFIGVLGVALFVALLSGPGTALALADKFECPTYIDDVEKPITDRLGWRSTQRESRHYLRRTFVSNADGAPVTAIEHTTDEGMIRSVWYKPQFGHDTLYLTCEYHGTSIILMRIIDKTYENCVMMAAKDENSLARPTFTCSR